MYNTTLYQLTNLTVSHSHKQLFTVNIQCMWTVVYYEVFIKTVYQCWLNVLQSLLQVCERIPTIGTQLKILSTVKATMLGAQGTLCLSSISSCVRISQHSGALISIYLNWSVTLIVLLMMMIINIYNVDNFFVIIKLLCSSQTEAQDLKVNVCKGNFNSQIAVMLSQPNSSNVRSLSLSLACLVSFSCWLLVPVSLSQYYTQKNSLNIFHYKVWFVVYSATFGGRNKYNYWCDALRLSHVPALELGKHYTIHFQPYC